MSLRRRSTLPLVLSILSLLGFFCYPHRGAVAQIRDYDYASTMITGYVQVKSNEGLLRPVTGATVLLFQTDVRSKKPGWSTKTGSAGEFAFVGLPKFAIFRIVATAPSIQEASQDNILLNRYRRTEIRLVAEPSESVSERKEEPLKATPPIGNDKDTIPIRRVYNHSIEITTEYDKFKDKTTVITGLMPAGARGNRLVRQRHASYRGRVFLLRTNLQNARVSRDFFLLDVKELEILDQPRIDHTGRRKEVRPSASKPHNLRSFGR